MADTREHNHYFKSVKGWEYIDVYRVLQLFDVTDPCVQHAVKKLLVAGGRGAGKDIRKDIKEAIDSLVRWQEMRKEEETPLFFNEPACLTQLANLQIPPEGFHRGGTLPTLHNGGEPRQDGYGGGDTPEPYLQTR